jgi:lauroyl/myristoyl acyltransferase
VEKQGEWVEFQGELVRMPLGSLRLAQMSDALILPALVTNQISLFSKKWKISFWQPIDPLKNGGKEEILQAMEEMIALSPENWNGKAPL